MRLSNFFAELKRRNVYKIAVAYAVVGWLLIQIATQVFPFFEIPNWTVRLIVLAIGIGFPIALIIAWAFEITPEGLKRTDEWDARSTPISSHKHTWLYIAAVGAVSSIALFFLGHQPRTKPSECIERASRKIDRRFALRQSQPRSGQRFFRRGRAG